MSDRIDVAGLSDEEWREFLSLAEKCPIITKRLTRQVSKESNAWLDGFVQSTILQDEALLTPCRVSLIHLPSMYKPKVAVIRPSWDALVSRIQEKAFHHNNAVTQPSDDSLLDLCMAPVSVNLVGQSGCGNSVFAFYLIALVLQKDLRIPGLVFDSGTKTYVLNSNCLKCGHFKDSIEDFVTVWKRSSGDTFVRDWRGYWTFQDTVVSLSYTRLHIRVGSTEQFQQTGSKHEHYFYHERWARDELLHVFKLCTGDIKSLHRTIAKRVKRFGPIPRELFSERPNSVIKPIDLQTKQIFQKYFLTAPWLLWWWPLVRDQSGRWIEPVGVSFISQDAQDSTLVAMQEYVARSRGELTRSWSGHLLLAYIDRFPVSPSSETQLSVEIVDDSDSDSSASAVRSDVIEMEDISGLGEGGILRLSKASNSAISIQTNCVAVSSCPALVHPPVSSRPPAAAAPLPPAASPKRQRATVRNNELSQSLEGKRGLAGSTPRSGPGESPQSITSDSSTQIVVVSSPLDGSTTASVRDVGTSATQELNLEKVITEVESQAAPVAAELIAKPIAVTSNRKNARKPRGSEASPKRQRRVLPDDELSPQDRACLLTVPLQIFVNEVVKATPQTPQAEELRTMILRSAEHYKELRLQMRLLKCGLLQLKREWHQGNS
eukprot:Gregarina_sp_Poly_1__8300@NODE_484_length_8016_cov_113_227827_g391_i0_p1_GENE_NODE_484_length_8016_cov_113_227827_g391_i0NODE_484_length_8016_cov_113_227827_g391_i0_p1_ORF_typecomplete_len660_score92_88_NODE_484_length_8016_cov_113_227827_g391_i059257904